MRRTVVLSGGLAAVGIWLLGPSLAAAAAVVGLLGATLHEIVHYTAAVAVGASNIDIGWDATGPYVAYDGDMNPVIQLSPPLSAILLAVWLTATTPFPNTSTPSVLAASFLLGLHSLSPTDYEPVRRRLTTSV